MKRIFIYAISMAIALASCEDVQIETKNDELNQHSISSQNSSARVAPADYGTYTIQSRLTDKYLEIGGPYESKYDNKSKLVQYAAPFGPAKWQKWLFNYKKTENGIRYYEIINHYSGKALDVDGGRNEVNLQLQQWNRNNMDPQLFQLRAIPGADGYFNIINKASGLALSLLNAGTDNDVAVVQAPLGQGWNQDWYFNPLEQDSYPDDQVIRFFQRNNKDLGSVAWDQGSSIALSWGPNAGKNLWVTQDAFDGFSFQDNFTFYCNHFFSYGNSILIQPPNNWDPNATLNMETPNGYAPELICDIQPGHTFAWPSNGVEIGNKVYMHCGEGSGLEALDQSIYVLTESADRKGWGVERKLVKGVSGQVDINYTSGMVKDNNYVYVFGTKGKNYGLENDVFCARFNVNTPLEWEFYGGFLFGKDVTTPVPVASVKATVAVTKFNGKYVMISMDQGFLRCEGEDNNERWIYASYADNPWGPYSPLKKVYQITDRYAGNWARYYTPNVHPQYNNGKNELLMTYSLNYSACGVDWCQNGGIDPDYYRLRAIRIPTSLMGM